MARANAAPGTFAASKWMPQHSLPPYETAAHVAGEHRNRPERDDRGSREAESAGRPRHVGDEPGDEMLPPCDAVHDARADRAAHELERALLSRPHLLLAGLRRDMPQALIGVGFAERQPHEHDLHLVPCGPATPQCHRHGHWQPTGTRLTGCRQCGSEAGRRRGEEGIVHRGTPWAHERLERFDIRTQKSNSPVLAALTEQHGGADVTTPQRLADAVQTDTQPAQGMPQPATWHLRRRSERCVRRRLPRLAGIEELLHDCHRGHPVGDRVMDAEHDAGPSRRRARYHQDLPRRTIQPERLTHELGTLLLETRKTIDGLHEPDVVLEVRCGFDPVVQTAHFGSPSAQRRQRRDPLVQGHAQLGHVRGAIRAGETARGEQTGDEEHVDLADMVKHQVRLVDRGQPLRHGVHATTLAARSPAYQSTKAVRPPTVAAPSRYESRCKLGPSRGDDEPCGVYCP